MSYRLLSEPNFLRLEFSGAFSHAELMRALAEVEAIERGTELVPNRLTNLTCVTSWSTNMAWMLSFVSHRKAQRFRNAFKSAIVAPDAAGKGFARMFQTLNDHPQILIRIFDRLDEAEAWLREPPAPSHPHV